MIPLNWFSKQVALSYHVVAYPSPFCCCQLVHSNLSEEGTHQFICICLNHICVKLLLTI
jgi:hypothetical protein